MLCDARSLAVETVSRDICIVGAGPAGIALAREWAGRKLEVVLLESGGLEFDAGIQALAEGMVHGDVKPPVDVNRRQFGGNANSWGIGLNAGEAGLRHTLFDPVDFEKRDWIANSGWPFSRDHLLPYYERAQGVCGAGPFAYAPECWEGPRAQRLPLAQTGFETGIFQFSANKVFLQQHRQALAAAENITVLTHASAVELLADEGGRSVSRVRVARTGRPDLQVAAKVFVLAAGGFENARLLLMSNRRQAAGLGNAHDVVGRYYHDHIQGRSGYLTPRDAQLFERTALYDLREVRGACVMAYLKLSKAAMAREKLLNISCFLFPKPGQRQTRAIESFNVLREKQLRPRSEAASVFPREGRLKHLLNVALGLDYVARIAYLAKTGQQSTAYHLCHGGWSGLDKPSERFSRFEVWHCIEQSPHRDNRVTLGPARDSLGCPKLEVHWHWPQEDIAQALRAQAFIASELARAGLGKLQLEYDPQGLPNIERPVGSHHLMGTTRMHVDPKQGVVDANCQVHGIGNLFVAGSSTFPTGGPATPTLTIVAMALRLADFLKQKLEGESFANPR